jgi:hypothetical protein
VRRPVPTLESWRPLVLSWRTRTGGEKVRLSEKNVPRVENWPLVLSWRNRIGGDEVRRPGSKLESFSCSCPLLVAGPRGHHPA